MNCEEFRRLFRNLDKLVPIDSPLANEVDAHMDSCTPCTKWADELLGQEMNDHILEVRQLAVKIRRSQGLPGGEETYD